MTQELDHGLHRQLKDAVYLQLRDDIISGALPTGTVLREVELVARFGVSKTPLRDALVRLQKDGFVDIPPYRSAVVTGYSDTDLREIYELRELLEGACARQAALHIGGEELAELEHIAAASAACVGGGEVIQGREEELATLIQQFDLALYAQSRNSRIDEMVGNIRGHVQRIGRLTTGIPGRLAKSVAEHQAIYDAIARRDSATAETLMRRHIGSVLADQLASMAR